MDCDASKISIKTKLISSSIQTNGALKGIFRGVIVGMIFSSLIVYIGIIDMKVNENETHNFKLENKSLVDDEHQIENIAEYLYDKVRVLCFVLPISKSTLNERGNMILKTWGKRCQIFIFFADDPDDNFKDNVVVLSDKSNNWSRLREAYAYIYKHYQHDFDWLLKVTDSAYIVMENLRWFLYQFDSDLPIAIGQRYLKEDYMMGVYAITRYAFIRLIEAAFINQEICDANGSDGDKEISKCLQHLNCIQIDGIDDKNRGMFFQNSPEALLFPEKYDKDFDKWYWHKLQQGINHCCSHRLIGIQNVVNTHLYYMEYFIYKVHAFGRHRLPEMLPKKKTIEEVIKKI